MAGISAEYNGAADGFSGWLDTLSQQMVSTAIPGLVDYAKAGEGKL
jgi:hypothetical protein